MESVQLNFTYTEKEYLAAARLFLWRSKQRLIRLVISYILLSLGLIALLSLSDLSLPLWVSVSLLLLVGIALFHGLVFSLPRRYFRGDPKFRDEYNLSFSDEGIRFQTKSVNASLAWSLYTEVIENGSLYLLIYGKNISSVSIIPKRAFLDPSQQASLRELLRRNIDQGLSTRQINREDVSETEYVPSTLEPPDWR